MSSGIRPIALHYLFDVNCYLVETGDGHVLIDTGLSRRRPVLEAELEGAGCGRGSLSLIVLTHAHTDHAGNCAYLREKFGSRIAMHRGDLGKVERGEMFWKPKGEGSLGTTLAKLAASLIGMGKFDAFEPDVLLEDGQDLSDYGLDARALHFPGHSPGSAGILTSAGDLFCGDLLTNTRKPERNSLVDDAEEMDASIEKLRTLGIRTVYPGHGAPFPIELLMGEPGAAR
ncbi:MAG: MBL fold metallo-hydrolase [Coriobacteriia bacterium]|nr:MBL fold metallo-hydrolase [Coriobacteriia bacterium]